MAKVYGPKTASYGPNYFDRSAMGCVPGPDSNAVPGVRGSMAERDGGAKKAAAPAPAAAQKATPAVQPSAMSVDAARRAHAAGAAAPRVPAATPTGPDAYVMATKEVVAPLVISEGGSDMTKLEKNAVRVRNETIEALKDHTKTRRFFFHLSTSLAKAGGNGKDGRTISASQSTSHVFQYKTASMPDKRTGDLKTGVLLEAHVIYAQSTAPVPIGVKFPSISKSGQPLIKGNT